MSKINFNNKVALNQNPEIPEINKVTADNMNEIKNAINQSINYNATTEDSAGKLKCTLTGTLASGDIVNVTIPTLTNTSSTMQLSIDNGVTYYYIKQLSADSVFTDFTNAEITNSKCSLYFDGTYFILDNSKYGGKLIANLNTIIKDDDYTCYTGATGLSTEMNALGVSFHIHHQNSNVGTGGAYQKAVAFSTDLIVYERTKVNSTWGNWINRSTINNLTTSSAGNGILDAYQGKILNDKITALQTYSIVEVDTGKIWADGKHVYSILLNSTCSNINTLITNLHIDTFINGYGKASSIYQNYWRIPTLYLAETGYVIILNVDGTISFGSFYGNNSCWYYLEYTKTS